MRSARFHEPAGDSEPSKPGLAQSPRIVVVGGGLSARWLLFALAEQLARGERTLQGARLTIMESHAEFGTGFAWSRRNALDDHLASMALPVSRTDAGDRQQQRFASTARVLRQFGVSVTLLPRHEATSLRPFGRRLEINSTAGPAIRTDYAVLATGHWQSGQSGGGQARLHRSPWPARDLQEAILADHGRISEARPKQVLILGSYLSAIDAALSLALKAGRFRTDPDGRLHFKAPAGLRIVMGSHLGQLPKVWGQDPPPRPLRWLCEERLRESFEDAENGRFLPIDAAMELLRKELAAAAERDRAPAATRGLGAHLDRGVAARRRRPTRAPDAKTLQHEIAAVLTTGKPFGLYAETRHCPWQSVISEALPLWSEHSSALCAEDQIFFDRELRTTFFNHMLPMPLNNALQIEAMMRSGHLTVVALGRTYKLAPIQDGARRWKLSFPDGSGRIRVLAFTDVVDATGQCADIARHPSPLIQGLLRSGTIQPGLRAFRADRKPAGGIRPGVEESIIMRGRRPYLITGGIFVNPKTCEVIPRHIEDVTYSGPEYGGIYAMGPNLVGQFIDAQSSGQTVRDARRIVSDMCRKQSGVKGYA